MHRTILLVASLALAAPPAAVAVVDAEQFKLRSGADLVELCSADPKDPLYTAAIHMCHGFGVGTYQTLQAVTEHKNLPHFFCPPQSSPSRNEVVAAFVTWARLHPDLLRHQPAELVGKYLVDTYPCPKGK